MTTATLQRKLSSLLPKGEKSIQGFVKESLIFRLQEVNKKIALFEGKYNLNFASFKQMWTKSSGKKKYSYEMESDYIDWEALEDYKRELMRVIHSL